jgi:hypothetical protein
MTSIRHFSDLGGQAVELGAIAPMGNAEFAARFPGVRGRRYDGYSMMVGFPAGRAHASQALPVTRSIQYKSNPSLHVCNAKCVGGKVNGVCECRCGGKNHGVGTFTSQLAKRTEQRADSRT